MTEKGRGKNRADQELIVTPNPNQKASQYRGVNALPGSSQVDLFLLSLVNPRIYAIDMQWKQSSECPFTSSEVSSDVAPSPLPVWVSVLVLRVRVVNKS
jgi:hypothetical protein